MSAHAEAAAPASSAALLTLAEEVSDAADTLSCTVETAKGLIALALKELELDTTTHAGSAIRGARLFIFELDHLVERLQILSGEAKGAAA